MKTPAAHNPTPGEPAPSPFGFTNVPAVEEPVEIPIQGTIPSWVNGVLYRSGSGRYNILDSRGDTHHITHPFDGLAMLHRFEVSGERQTVLYNSRHTSHGLEDRIRQNDRTLLTFGPDPCKTIFGRMQTFFYHLSEYQDTKRKLEQDPEYDLVNVTITPNFPIGPHLEAETGVKRGEALVIKRDADTLQLVDKDTLKPLKMFTYSHIDKKLWGLLCASHHQYDRETNEYVNFMVRLGPIPSFQTFSIRPFLKEPNSGDDEMSPPTTTVHEPIWRHLGSWNTMETLKPAYIHSFNMTKNYIIIPNFPYYYGFGGMAALYYSNAYQTFHWESNRRTLFHVIDRHTKRHIATYEADPCFGFHAANAWDELVTLPGGQTERVIYLDYCIYENTDIVDASFELGKLDAATAAAAGGGDGDAVDPIPHVKPVRYVVKKKAQGKAGNKIAPSQVRRYRLGQLPDTSSTARWTAEGWTSGYLFKGMLDFEQRRVASYQVLASDVELPRFDERRNLQKYRYLYGVCESRYAPSYAAGAVVNGLIKVDLDRPFEGPNVHPETTARTWDQPGASCSEPVFVPNPHSDDEDDGVVLSIVNSTTEANIDLCYLLILDARTMLELGRATLGSFNALTLHGSFVGKDGVGLSIN
ncbi:putative carotene oxygenase [Dichotomocladium elegans]|nr:putative carotene oxygenase [Dichotomocladium elegans]